jgi:hypothetical protein
MPLADFSLYVLADAPATAATLNRSSVILVACFQNGSAS